MRFFSHPTWGGIAVAVAASCLSFNSAAEAVLPSSHNSLSLSAPEREDHLMSSETSASAHRGSQYGGDLPIAFAVLGASMVLMGVHVRKQSSR